MAIREKLDETLNERFIIPPKTLSRFKFITSDYDLTNKIQTLRLNGGNFDIAWENVRPIPNDFGWFENIWKGFQEDKIFD